MTMPADLIGVGAEALIQNAQRLGLTWSLELATIATLSSSNGITAIYDGDSVPIGMTSMIGAVVPGERVYALRVPPSGNFIIGAVNIARQFVTRALLTTSASSITLNIPPAVNALDIYWSLRSDEGPGTGATGTFRVNSISAAGYVIRFWELANTTGSAGTHTQSFGTTEAAFGVYPTGAATTGRFGGGRISFPAWNDPQGGSLTWTFAADVELAVDSGFLYTGGGLLTVAGPYTSITFSTGASGSFVAGSQITAYGTIID